MLTGDGFHHLEPIRALWVGVRMGTFCSCASARKITKDKFTRMAGSVEETDAAVQVVVSLITDIITLKDVELVTNNHRCVCANTNSFIIELDGSS